jgi:hypothetical protein
MKTPKLMTILLFAILFAITPVKSQSIRTIQADTIFKGYESGETSSVKIINHGISLIYNHSGKLYEMSAITYEPVREIKLDESQPVTKFSVDGNCKYIIYNTNTDTITFVADYNTGKTIKTLKGTYYLGYHFIYIVKGFHYPSSKIIRYSLADLSPKDTLIYKLPIWSGFIPEFKNIRTIPNSEDIIVSTGGIYGERGNFDEPYSYNIVDFSTDSIRPIYLHQSSNGEGSAYSYLLISEDLKYNILEKSEYNTSEDENRNHITTYVDTDFFIHDSNYKYIDDIKESEIRKLFNDPTIRFQLNGIIVQNQYLAFGFSRLLGGITKNQIMIYDLNKKIVIAIIDFNLKSFSFDNKFIFSNKSGCLATLSLDQVPVLEDKKLSADYSVNYTNNTLLITSQESKKADITILDMTGAIVFIQKDINVNSGISSFKIDNQLSCGIYFCIVQTPEAAISRKFMVIQ